MNDHDRKGPAKRSLRAGVPSACALTRSHSMRLARRPRARSITDCVTVSVSVPVPVTVTVSVSVSVTVTVTVSVSVSVSVSVTVTVTVSVSPRESARRRRRSRQQSWHERRTRRLVPRLARVLRGADATAGRFPRG